MYQDNKGLRNCHTQVVFDKCWECMNEIEKEIMNIENVCVSNVYFSE